MQTGASYVPDVSAAPDVSASLTTLTWTAVGEPWSLSIRLDRLDLDDCLPLVRAVNAHGVNPLAWLYGLAFVDDLIALREREPLVELVASVVLEANRQHPELERRGEGSTLTVIMLSSTS